MSNTITFVPISPGQARALGRLASRKSSPAKLIVANDGEKLIVVPPSNRDRRCWNITRGGKITRVPR